MSGIDGSALRATGSDRAYDLDGSALRATGPDRAYAEALQKIERERGVAERLLDERVQAGWLGKQPIADIARDTGLHYADVMDRARVLGLNDRCPVTRVLLSMPLAPPLPAEAMAH